MRLLRTIVLILALGALLLPGCTPAEAVCQPANLVAPHLNSPIDYAHLTSNKPLLTWEFKAVTYPSPGAPAACHPDKYRVSISTAPLFTDELGSDVTAAAVTGGWTSPALQYGKTYHWNVTAMTAGGVLGPTSVTRTFSIGSDCTEAQLQAPVLLQPANNSIVDTTTPKFRWDTTMTCLPKGYYFRYSTDPTLLHGGTVGGGSLSGGLDWIGTYLSDCTIYYWRVAAFVDDPPVGLGPFDGLPGVGPSSGTWMFKVMLPGTTSCWAAAPAPTATATSTPTPVPPVPVGEKPWEVTANANCRACPSGGCNETGFAPKGYLATIEGRNEDATWFRIKDPRGVSCWVWGGALKVPADAGSLGLLAYPTPPPAEVPPVQVNCARFKDVRTCLANPACTWDRAKQACVQK